MDSLQTRNWYEPPFNWFDDQEDGIINSLTDRIQVANDFNLDMINFSIYNRLKVNKSSVDHKLHDFLH
jgi:hypothetical protein